MTEQHDQTSDDGRGLNLGDLSRLVCAAELAELDLPHLVVCTDPESGTSSYSGPFPDALTAMVFAERESRTELEKHDGVPLRFSVSALYPGARCG